MVNILIRGGNESDKRYIVSGTSRGNRGFQSFEGIGSTNHLIGGNAKIIVGNRAEKGTVTYNGEFKGGIKRINRGKVAHVTIVRYHILEY